MEHAEIIHYATKALMLTLLLSLPPIIVASVVGTIISIIQALTQVQEQTLSFAGKLIAIFITLYLTSAWLGSSLFNFGNQVFAYMAKVLSSGS
tara:strand:- start:180 stop:458 length:279 start_codon:yes stop_codon:yes gene_type:complete